MQRKTCLSFLVISIFLAHCSKNNSDRSLSPALPSITWEYSGNLSTINAPHCTTPGCLQHATLTMEGLFKIVWTESDWIVENALAEDWEVKPNRFVVSLKKNILWSDGKKLSSFDFLSAWKTVLSQCSTLDTFPALKSISGTLAYCKKEIAWEEVSIRAPDQKTLQIDLEKPEPHLLRVFAHPLFFPHRTKPKPAASLGAFLMMELNERTARYVPNPNYHYGPPRIGQLRIVSRSSQANSLVGAQTQQIELAGPLTSSLGLENVETKQLLRVPRLERFAATVTPPTPPATESWKALQWTEPQRLGHPNNLPCIGNQLCSLTQLPSRSTATSKSAPLLLIESPDDATQPLAENLANQWRAVHRAKAQIVTQIPSTAGPALVIRLFSFPTHPYVSPFPSVDLAQQCQNRGLPKPPGWRGHWEESDVRKMENLLWRALRCIPLSAGASNFVRHPDLTGLLWTPHGAWDFSRSSFTVSRKKRTSPEG